MPLEIVDGPTIAEGESLSDSADCSQGTIVRITVPKEYFKGNMPHHMTFQASSDGNLFNELVDDKGEAVSIVAREDSTIVIDRSWARVVAFLKIRSGTKDAPVKQKEDCRLGIAIDTGPGGASSEASRAGGEDRGGPRKAPGKGLHD